MKLSPPLPRWLGRTMGAGLALAWLIARAHGPLHEQIQQLTEGLTKQPDNADLLIQRAELYQVHGLFSEARLDLDVVDRVQPANITNRLRRGLLELAARETNAAIAQLSAWIEQRPDSLDGHLGLAQAWTLANQPAKAVPHFDRVIAMAGRKDADEDQQQVGARPELFLERAKAQVSAGLNVTNTLAGLDEGITRMGPLPVLERFAADLEMKRGAVEAAVGRIGAIMDRAERKERWLLQQGDLYRQGGRTNEARAKYLAARDALGRLPDKLQRAWVATELRQQVDSRLAETASAQQTPSHP